MVPIPAVRKGHEGVSSGLDDRTLEPLAAVGGAEALHPLLGGSGGTQEPQYLRVSHQAIQGDWPPTGRAAGMLRRVAAAAM